MTSKAFFNAKKLARMLSAIDYSLVSDGTADDGPVLVAMGAALGLVVVPSGNTRIKTNTTIIGLMVFEPGAYLTIDAGVTLNIEGLVHSPAQYIFRGLGTVLFGGDPATNTYSMARVAKSEWFGVKAGALTDQIPALQLACNSMSTVREGVVTEPIGAINHQTTLTIPRCVHLLGRGSRRTVHSMPPDGVTAFVTGGVGVRIEGIQVEAAAGAYHSGAPCLNVLHTDCEVIDFAPGSTTQGILVSPAGSFCRIDRTSNLVQPTVLVAGSSVIEIQASNCTVTSTRAHSGAAGQFLESIVKITTNGNGISGTTVTGTTTSVIGAVAVNLVAVADNIALTTVDGIQQTGSTGTGFNSSNTGAAAVQGIIVRNVQVAANATLGAGVFQSGAGSTSRVFIDGVTAAGGAGTGITLSQTGGTMSDVKIGICNIAGATTPITPPVGTINDLRIDKLTMPVKCVAPGTFSETIANNGVFTLATSVSIFGSQLHVTVNNAESGRYLARAAATPACTTEPGTTPTTNMASTTGILTGTTGTVGKFTVSTDASGNYYFENRLGASALVQITLATGIQTTVL